MIWRDSPEVPPFTSAETHAKVHPGLIPARDQVLSYAAQTRLSFAGFEQHVRDRLGDARGVAVLGMCTSDARAVWRAYAFLAPGGNPFQPLAGLQHGQKFGVKSAFGYLLDKAENAGREVDLTELVTDSALDGTDYVRIAKARAVEAAFIGYFVNAGMAATPASGGGGGP